MTTSSLPAARLLATVAVALLLGALMDSPQALAAGKADAITTDLRSPMNIAEKAHSNGSKGHGARPRADIDRALEQQEAACYQRFVVTSCLVQAREEARSERAVLDERDRLEKAADRQSRSEAHEREKALKQADQRSAVPRQPATDRSRTRAVQPGAKRDPGVARRPLGGAKAGPVRSAGAAEQLRSERAAGQAQRDARAARAKARAVDQRAAAARRLQMMAERQQAQVAKGRVPAAPLPAAESAYPR